MKDWDKCQADVNRIMTKHFSSGRGGAKVQAIAIHYNAGNLTIDGCYSVWQTREASAHYQVEDGGRIGQLVWDKDTAWAVGNFYWNQRTISIEHANRADGTISAACLDNGSHLVAALCKMYGLGRPQWGVNVFPHKHYSSTSCPGQIYGTQKDAYIKQAQMWYDQMVNGGAAPSQPAQPSAPAPSKPSGTSNFGGTYTCMVNGLRVRTGPGLGYGVVTQYNRGMTVVLDNWYKSVDGYIWGRYTGNSGNVRYIAVGRATGKVESDDFLVKGGTVTPSHQVSQPDLIPAGTYRINVDVLNIRTGPGLGYATLGTTVYRRGNTVVLDGTEQTADGYVWGRYLGGSGKHRWIAVRTTGGASYANKVA